MRVGLLSRRYQGTRASARIDRNDFDGVQVIRRESQLAAEETEGPTDHVSAHSDRRVFAERYYDSPQVEQRAESLTHGRASFDA